MNFSFTTITSFLKKVKGGGTQSQMSHQLFYPSRDWSLILIANAVFLILMMGFGVYTFITSNQGVDTALEMDTIELVDVDVNALDEVLAFFEEKSSMYNDLRERAPQSINPF